MPGPSIPSHGRLWIAWLWALVLSASLTAGERAVRLTFSRAADRALLLVPRETWNEERRSQALATIQGYKEVGRARWLSPGALAQEAAQAVPGEQWSKLFPEESAWLPWVVEARFRNPILDRSAVETRLRSLRSDPNWKLVLWDEAALRREAALPRTLAIFGGSAFALVLLIGGAALWFSPAPSLRFRTQALGGGLGGLLLAAILGGAAWIGGAGLDARSWAIGLGSSFALAGLLAPMIKRRPLPAVSSASTQIGQGTQA